MFTRVSTLALLLVSATSLAFFGSDKKKDENLITQEAKNLLAYEQNTILVANKAVNSVVHITTTALAQDWFFGIRKEVPRGSGSGFVWDDKGHIVTNFHVVQGAQSFIVRFHGDKSEYKAKVVGTAPRKDIAVLKLTKLPKELFPVKPGSSKSLIVGQKAVAIGNPFGLDHTVTSGIISALGRKIPGVSGLTISDMIQTDASINQGNSGGPLFNSRSEVIGMNTMIYSTSGSSAGIGFAVPVDTVKRIVPQLIQHGKVIRPGLGVQLLDDRLKQRFGIKEGVVIYSLEPKGPAAKAGLRGVERDRRGRFYLGDIILAIGGAKVNEFDDIYHALDKKNIGDKVKVKVDRDGKKKEFMVTLDKVPN